MFEYYKASFKSFAKETVSEDCEDIKDYIYGLFEAMICTMEVMILDHTEKDEKIDGEL